MKYRQRSLWRFSRYACCMGLKIHARTPKPMRNSKKSTKNLWMSPVFELQDVASIQNSWVLLLHTGGVWLRTSGVHPMKCGSLSPYSLLSNIFNLCIPPILDSENQIVSFLSAYTKLLQRDSKQTSSGPKVVPTCPNKHWQVHLVNLSSSSHYACH